MKFPQIKHQKLNISISVNIKDQFVPNRTSEASGGPRAGQVGRPPRATNFFNEFEGLSLYLTTTHLLMFAIRF